MIVRPWELGDTALIELQESQEYTSNIMNLNADLTEMSEEGRMFTFEHDGEIMGVAGFSDHWTNRTEIWALFSRYAGRHFTFIYKFALFKMKDIGSRRYESTVDVGFKQGHRFMKMLGFEVEGYLKAYRPDGADMVLYARVK